VLTPYEAMCNFCTCEVIDIDIDIDIDIYLTAIGLAPCGGITRLIYNQTISNLHREKNLGSAVRAPSLLSVIPWHSPNNREKHGKNLS
jgi:hypothetical protein